MALGPRVRLALGIAAFGTALALPQAGFAACSIPAPTDFDHNGSLDLKLAGDTNKQTAIVELRGSGGYLAQIDCNANGSYGDGVDVTRSGPESIETYIVALAGADTITVVQTEDLVGATKNVVVPFGAGVNRFTFRSQGFTIGQQSSLAFEVRGGAGLENVNFDFSGGSITDSMVVVRGDLGDGANVGGFVGAAQTTNSVVDVNLTLGYTVGNTTGTYNDGGGLVTNSTVNVHLQGNDAPKALDTVTTTFTGQLQDNSRFSLYANLQQGDDRYFSHFDVSSFAIDAPGTPGSEMLFRVNAGLGFDLLKVDDLAISGASTVNGLLAFDLAGGPQPDAIGLVWHGLTGAGQFRYRADGGVTNDKINGTFVADPTSANTLLFQFMGDTEMDISALAADIINVLFDAPVSASYGPLPGIVLDGGMQGDDTCNFTGTATHAAFGCEKGKW